MHSFAALVVLAAWLLSCAGSVYAAEPSWSFVAPQAPPAPPGTAQAPYGVPVGEVGEISFWAPNRGLMITGGTAGESGPVKPGLYAYDGESWHQLATVCGGAEGRIVWAGPDEFWTIADQRSGQVIVTGSKQAEAPAVSLCHFFDGQVVGSYAMPLDEPESWVQMTAGACYSPSDCWFGGLKGRAPHVGAFHLHWDGSTVSAVYEPEDHSVFGMVDFEGSLLESVGLEAGDEWLPEEERRHPATIHSIAPTGVEPTFGEYFLYDEGAEHDLPVYGEGVLPEALQAFDLATNAPDGEGATQLWAAANPSSEAPSELSVPITVLRDDAGSWSQVIPTAGGESPLAVGAESPLREAKLGGSALFSGVTWGTADAIAPEPGSEDAWLSLQTKETGAVVTQLEADGKLARTDVLPEAGDAVGYRGEAGPIVCPAAHDCWLATVSEKASESGWLFHLSDGAQEEPDSDPFFDGADGVIENRPHDAGLPIIYPYVPPVDDSLANQQQVPPLAPPTEPTTQTVKTKKGKRLVKDVKSKLLHHRTLVISFMLTASAHVQLIARRHGKIVAKTPRKELRGGRHALSLALDPQSWPTKLQFEAKPIGASGSTGAESESPSSGSGDTVLT
ncbi:MAG: hypothetical protein WBQ21_04540 [Solirubrobacteraceae bacterium]